MARNSFLKITLEEENCRELAKQQQRGKTATRRKLMLSCTLYGKYFVFCLYSNRLFTHVDKVK